MGSLLFDDRQVVRLGYLRIALFHQLKDLPAGHEVRGPGQDPDDLHISMLRHEPERL